MVGVRKRLYLCFPKKKVILKGRGKERESRRKRISERRRVENIQVHGPGNKGK